MWAPFITQHMSILLAISSHTYRSKSWFTVFTAFRIVSQFLYNSAEILPPYINAPRKNNLNGDCFVMTFSVPTVNIKLKAFQFSP